MNPCDPTINRSQPVPTTGEPEPNPHVAENNAREEGRQFYRFGPGAKQLDREPPFTPIKCEKCGTTHNLHGDCAAPLSGGQRPNTIQLPGEPKFNSLHISRLAVKVDGETEHVFIAILNGSAVGQVIAKVQIWKACAIQMLYVMPVHRHKGVATRLFQAVEQFARREKATQLELCCLKANTAGRAFWIRKAKFIDDSERDAGGDRSAEYVCMKRDL